MKKVLLFAILLLLTQAGYAQSGKLTLLNDSKCDIYLHISARKDTYDFAPCSITSCLIVVPALSTITYANAVAFSASICYYTTVIPAAIWPSITDFYYTDATFQYNCDGVGFGGNLSEGLILNCLTASGSWSSAPHSATWSSTIAGSPMSDVVIVFL